MRPRDTESGRIQQPAGRNPLFEDNYITPAGRKVKTVDINKFTAASPSFDSQYSTIVEQADILLPSWVFADTDNSSQAVQLKATITEDDVDNSYTSAIGHEVGSDSASKNYTLLRNKDYTLTASVTNYMVTIGASVTSWADQSLSIEDNKPVIPDL